MGPSGSGKSTLLTIAGSLEVPSHGEVVIDGVTVSAMSRNDRARLRRRSIGYVFQDFNLLAGLSALENVCLPMELDGIAARQSACRRDGSARGARAHATARSSFPDELSGGERQRVAIARAVVGDRHLLLADEPSGALDSANAESVIRLIRAACQRGVAGRCGYPRRATGVVGRPGRVPSRRARRRSDDAAGRTGVAARAGSEVVSLALEERPRELEIHELRRRAGATGDLPLVVATVPARVAPAGARGGADGVRGRGDDRRSGARLQRGTSARLRDGDGDGFDDVRRGRPRGCRGGATCLRRGRGDRPPEHRDPGNPATRSISAPRTRTARTGIRLCGSSPGDSRPAPTTSR